MGSLSSFKEHQRMTVRNPNSCLSPCNATTVVGPIYSCKYSHVHPGFPHRCLIITAKQFQGVVAGKIGEERKAVIEICSISICVVVEFLIKEGCVPYWS